MATKYHTKSHCKYMIKMHMIFVVKYRKYLLNNGLNEDTKQIMFYIIKDDDSLFSIEIQECDGYHLHMLLDIEPNTSAALVASRLKQMSTYRIWQKYGELLKKHFWEEHTFWSGGYFYMFDSRCLS